MKGMLLAACGLGAALLLAGPLAMAEALAYRLDPVHSRILFRVDHNGFSRAMGTFSRPQGVLFFDPEDWTTARLDVRVDLATLDLGDEGFNARILAPAWLDAGAFPEARFVSERVEPIDENRARVHGTLRLRGVQAPLTLEVRLNRLAHALQCDAPHRRFFRRRHAEPRGVRAARQPPRRGRCGAAGNRGRGDPHAGRAVRGRDARIAANPAMLRCARAAFSRRVLRLGWAFRSLSRGFP